MGLTEMKFSHLPYRIKALIVVLFVNVNTNAQNVTLDFGVVRSTTPWKIAAPNGFSSKSIREPKMDFALSVGLEYWIKKKSSLMSSLSYYQSGGKLAVYEYPEARAQDFWVLEDNEYDIPYLTLNTNYNMVIWRKNKIKLAIVSGIHLDYILEGSEEVPAGTSPLQQLYFFDAINRFNLGPNIGASIRYDFDRSTIGVQYLNSPRLRNLGDYNAEDNSRLSFLSNVRGISVQEKIAFTQITFGYKLK
jgi:hypothetical protein|tara:strand:+ start:902 stop:1642 length:741 start_codon:yes stop_codon:yes gene_type:complete